MRNYKLIIHSLALLLCIPFLQTAAFSDEQLPHPSTYLPHPSKVKGIKGLTDDPRDLVTTYPLNKVLPSEVYETLACDIEATKRQWAQLVGFKSPDLVGKIAPEIKPGKYTYKDLEQHPGLKELFPPEYLRHIKPGGPPLVGNVPEFEIVPTRQLYWSWRLCEATKQNLGKTKLDKDGYIVPRSWQGGIPFPRPSGKFKGQQVLYNFLKRPDNFERCLGIETEAKSCDRNLRVDKYHLASAHYIRFMGRTLFKPYGWLDKRAEKLGEYQASSSLILEPRANRGLVVLQYMYDDPNKMDPWMTYIPSLRRIRKMAASDTQDPQGDMAYDDRGHLVQKITPKKYPYQFDVIAEREYLLSVGYNTAKGWVDSKNGYARRDMQFMRRPCYVLQLTQLDRNYLYSKRILYIDKETFSTTFSANFDQRGRLYRSQGIPYVFMEDMGQSFPYGQPAIQWDHLDSHSTFQMLLQIPANFARKDFSMQELIKKGK